MNRYYKELSVTHPEPIRIFVAQGSNAVPMWFKIIDWTIPDEAGTNIYMKKPSGALIYNEGEVEDNSCVFEMTTQMSAELGVTKGQIEIIKDTKVYYSWIIELFVLETIVDASAVESTDEFTVLQQRIADADDAIEIMTQWVDGFIAPYQYGGVNYLPGTVDPNYSATFQNPSYTANGTATWGSMPVTQIDAPSVGAIFNCTAVDNSYRHDLQYTVALPVGRGTYQFTCFAYSTQSQDEFSISADSQYIDWIKDAYGEHSDHPSAAYGLYSSNTAPNALQKNLCVFEKTTAQALTVTFSIGMPYDRVETLYLCGFQLEHAAAPADWRPAISDYLLKKDIGGSLPIPVAYGGTGQTSLSNVAVGKATKDASGNTITSYYAPIASTPAVKSASSSDANSYTTTGTYFLTSSMSLTTANHWPYTLNSIGALLRVFADGDGGVWQIFKPAIGTGFGNDYAEYVRTGNGSSWGSWNRTDQTPITAFTSPTVYSGRCVVNYGGYLRYGMKVDVSLNIKMTYTNTSTSITSQTILTDLPVPGMSAAIICNNQTTGELVPCFVSTSGNLTLRLGAYHVNENDFMYIAGSYYAAT